MRLLLIEELVAPFEDVDLGVEEFGIVLHVETAVDLSQSLVHCRTPLLAELTVKHDHLVH